jgi:putative phosphoribosyl transferase
MRHEALYRAVLPETFSREEYYRDREEGPQMFSPAAQVQEVAVRIGEGILAPAFLGTPEKSIGLVVFAHGSGSSRHSPRNRFVADALAEGNLATLLLDLLTPEEEAIDRSTRALRFDIGLLARRVVAATQWVRAQPALRELRLGYFGASTGAAAALVAAAASPDEIDAVVSRGGRPDLAGAQLRQVRAPTLLIVGGADYPVIDFNRRASAQMRAPRELVVVPGATHLFEEPGALAEVARLSRAWFQRFLGSS